MNNVNCSKCGAEMPQGVKFCPSCGGKQKKPIYKKWWFWVIAAVVIIAVANSGDKGSDPSVVEKSTTETSQSEGKTKYLIGDVIATDKFEIKISNVKTVTKVGSQYFNTTPAEGGIYVVVEWEAKNITDSPISSFSCPSISLTDKNGTKYDEDIGATSYYATEVNLDRKILSDLNPGINVKDAQIFEVSKDLYDAGGFSVFINADKDFSVSIN